MKAIRKRLTQYIGKNYTVILWVIRTSRLIIIQKYHFRLRLTLTVLETCVKNCGKNFHILVANKEFIQELVKLIGPKYDPPTAVQEKVLSLIQIWADTFASQPDLKGVVEVYQELRNKGIEFPSIDPDQAVPIYTPQKVRFMSPAKYEKLTFAIFFAERRYTPTCSATTTTTKVATSRCKRFASPQRRWNIDRSNGKTTIRARHRVDEYDDSEWDADGAEAESRVASWLQTSDRLSGDLQGDAS